MLIDLQIQNWGPFKDRQILSFEATNSSDLEEYYIAEPIKGLRLLKLALLYGPNAAGKSFVLLALEQVRNMVANPPLEKDEPLYYNPCQVAAASEEEPSIVCVSFVKNGVRFHFSISWSSEGIRHESMLYYPKGRVAVLYERTTDAVTGLSSLHFGSTAQVGSADVEVLNGNLLSNVPVLAAYRRSNVFVSYMAWAVDWFLNDVRAIITPTTSLTRQAGDFIEQNAEVKSLIVQQLKLADLQITDIKVDTYDTDGALHELSALPLNREFSARMEQKVNNRLLKRQSIRFLHESSLPDGKKQNYWLNMANESAGTLRYLGLATLLAQLSQSSKIVSIDELDSALHPDLMKHFLLQFLINTSQSQLLVSTHNVLLLDEKDVLRPDAIWFIEKDNAGTSSLYALSDFDSKIFRKGGSILNAYKTGRLGATPDTVHMPLALN